MCSYTCITDLSDMPIVTAALYRFISYTYIDVEFASKMILPYWEFQSNAIQNTLKTKYTLVRTCLSVVIHIV